MDTNFLEDYYGESDRTWKETLLEDTKHADEGFETFANGKESFEQIDSTFRSFEEKGIGSLNSQLDDNMSMNVLNSDDTEFLTDYSSINDFNKTTLIKTIKEDKNENQLIPDVNDIKNHVSYNLFQESEKKENFNDSIKGIIAPSILSGVFFSRKNINNLHNKIKLGIKKILNYTIDNQSEEEMQIIMRSVYLQHSKNTDCEIQSQVKHLNKEVLDYSISNIYTNIKQYLGYIKNISENSDFVMPPSKETSIYGNKRGYRMDQLIDHTGGLRRR
tara:strand:- start:1216 stop:2037 length:822 start_codon:yes stop_codon:yes gene_type:complete